METRSILLRLRDKHNISGKHGEEKGFEEFELQKTY